MTSLLCNIRKRIHQWYFSSKNNFSFSFYAVLGNHLRLYVVLVLQNIFVLVLFSSDAIIFILFYLVHETF